jgi:hypothetical protein
VKGSTAVTPAPILHEFQDDSSRSNSNEQSASVRTSANSEGLLVVMPHMPRHCKPFLMHVTHRRLALIQARF